MSISGKKALVVDFGLFSTVAMRLARDCASVKYYSFWEQPFVEDLKKRIGSGFAGVERVNSPWDHIDDVDFIFFPDTMCGSMVEFLKRHDYPVCGSGRTEKLECDREYGRKVQEKNGLNVQRTEYPVGVSALREYLKDKKNLFVKVDDEFRGISESFKHTDLKSSESRIDWITFKAGPFKEKVKFIVEEKLKGVEPGYDIVSYDGDIVYPALGGYEKSKNGYVGRVYRDESEFPMPFQFIHSGLAPELKKDKFRQFYSTEMIIGKDKEPYLIDPCMRGAMPGPAAVQTELFENYSEVVYGLATGSLVPPRIKHKYAAALTLESPEAEKSFLRIEYPKEIDRWIKPIMCCKIGGELYSIPPYKALVTVVSVGNSVKEVMDTVIERVDEIDAVGSETDKEGFRSIPEDIEEGRKVGVEF